MAASSTAVEVGGRSLTLSNLDKVLYPSGFTKGEVIDYYARIAPFALPHLANRALTFKRFPNGSDTTGFFEKRCPKHRPAWVEVALGPGDRNGDIEYCCIDEPASAGVGGEHGGDRAARADGPRRRPRHAGGGGVRLRPGRRRPTSGSAARSRSACSDVLAAVDLDGWCKTSGSKGLQLYVPLNTPATHEAAAEFALAVGQLLEKQRPQQVTTIMAKVGATREDLRRLEPEHPPQDDDRPLLAARPAGADGVDAGLVGRGASCASGAIDPLRFEAADVLARVATLGDLFEPVLSEVQQLPGRGS